MRRSSLVCCALIVGLSTLALAASDDPNALKQKYFESGQKYFAEGKYAEAALQFQNAIQVDPRFAAAHYQLAQTYLQVRDGQHAYAEELRALELQPDNYKAHADLANMLAADYASTSNASDLTIAREQTNLLLQKQPNDPDTHLTVANVLSAQRKYKEAIEEIQKAITLGPNHGDFYLVLAQADAKAGDFNAAEANYKKAVDLKATGTNPRMALAEFYQSRGRNPEAEQEIEKVIASDPKNLNARASMAKLYWAEDKKPQAEALLNQVKRDFPDNASAYRMPADFYFEEGDLDRALAEYASLHNAHGGDLMVSLNFIRLLLMKNRVDEADKLNEELLRSEVKDDGPLVFRGEIQLRRGKVDEAIQTLQSVMVRHPDLQSPDVADTLGQAFFQKGANESAIGMFHEAVRLSDKNPTYYYHLGLAYEKTGKTALARQYFEQASKIDPNYGKDPAVANDLAYALLETYGDPDRALQLAQSARHAMPKSAEVADTLGLALYRKGAYQSAIDMFEEAIELGASNKQAENPTYHYHLGLAYKKAEKPALARQHFEHALAIDPNYTDAADIRKQLALLGS